MNQELDKLDNKKLLELILDSLHVTILHYGTWFYETEHQIGLDRAIEADDVAWKRLLPIILGRVIERLEIPTKDGIPESLANATKGELMKLLTNMAKNWLASDGTWFRRHDVVRDIVRSGYYL